MTNFYKEQGQKRWTCLKKFLSPSILYEIDSQACISILQKSDVLTFDSREIRENAVWIPQHGSQVDGHDLLGTFGRSICIVLADISKISFPKVQGNTWIIPIFRSKEFYEEFISEYYDFPSKRLQVVGITGTNGKTSTTIFTQKLFSILGKLAGSIGTLGANFLDENIEIINTTPNNVVLQRTLRQMVDKQIQVVAMEISSHALELGRTNGVLLDAAVLTNITQDHLDFHHTFENYFFSKMKILDLLEKSNKSRKDFFIWDGCQEKDFFLKNLLHIDRWNFSVSQESQSNSYIHIQLVERVQTGAQIKVFLKEQLSYEGYFPLWGDYNYINFAGAISVVSCLEKLSSKELQELLIEIQKNDSLQVPGRLEKIHLQNGKLAIVDYAHTPDGLKNVLQTIVQLPHKRIFCLFGCGGNRDKTKREKMGKVASDFCNVVFLTSDNPRNEDPLEIMDMIAKGIPSSVEFYKIEDRKKAIAFAAQYMNPGDILLITGKGHETYQLIGNDKIPFDDRGVLREFFCS